MTDCQFLGILVNNKQKKKTQKNNSKNFQRQRLTNNHKSQSQNSWLFRRNIKLE